MMSESLVTVVIPVYNGAQFLRQSVASALAQTYPNVEVLIVDDGSTDGTGQLADLMASSEPRVRVVHKANAGLAAARNTGIEHASGAYLNFLDADDWLLPEKIARQIKRLQERPDVDLVYSDYQKISDPDWTVFDMNREAPPLPFADILVYRNWFGVMAPLIRRRLIERAGAFDPAFRSAEDWDFWYRCAQVTEFLYEPGILSMVRLHGNQMTGNDRRMTEAQLQFAAKHFSGDRKKRRSHAAAFHLLRAIRFRQADSPLRCGYHLARFAASVNSPAEARFVWKLVRQTPMTQAGALPESQRALLGISAATAE